MRLPKLKEIFAQLLVVLCIGTALNGCSTVTIQDATIYGDKGVLGASYAHLLTNETGDIGQPAWDNQRFGMLCMSSDDFANLKSELEELCHLSNECTYEQIQQIEVFFGRIGEMQNGHFKGN